MKHAFQNLNVASKNTVAKANIDSDSTDLENYADECFLSFEKVKKDDNAFWSQHKMLADHIYNSDAYAKNEGDIKQAQSLIASLLQLDFRDIAQSQDWKVLMNLIEDREASRVEKIQRSWKNHLETLQASVSTSLGMIKVLDKRLSR